MPEHDPQRPSVGFGCAAGCLFAAVLVCCVLVVLMATALRP